MSASPPSRFVDLAVLAVLLLAVLVQVPNGIRFGDGLEFVAVASHLGVAHPPGYPLFTLLGWVALQVFPCSEPYESVLWMCKLATFAAAAGLYRWACFLFARMGVAAGRAVMAAGGSALIFLFSHSVWPTQMSVEVYGLNAAFLVWVGYFLTRASADPAAGGRALLSAAVLLGLSLSNHTTSGCLGPALLLTAWSVARARSFVIPVVALVVVVVVPAVFYGTLMWRVPQEYGIGWDAPESLPQLIRNLRGGEYGKVRFLMADPITPFTFDTWAGFALGRIRALFEALGGLVLGGGWWSWIAAVPLVVLAGCGVVARAVDGKRVVPSGIWIGAAVLFAFVLVFNIPDFGDHLIGVVVLLTPAILVGAASVFSRRWAANLAGRSIGGLAAVLLVLLVMAIATNRTAAYPPERNIAGPWLERFLKAVPRDAALLTTLDSDLFAIWYAQMARGERRDVLVYPANFVRYPWVRKTMSPGDRRRDLVGFGPSSEIPTVAGYMADLRRRVYDPLFRSGSRVVTTMHRPEEIDEARKYFTLRKVVDLVSPEEFQILMKAAEGATFNGAPFLLEVQPRR